MYVTAYAYLYTFFARHALCKIILEVLSTLVVALLIYTMVAVWFTILDVPRYTFLSKHEAVVKIPTSRVLCASRYLLVKIERLCCLPIETACGAYLNCNYPHTATIPVTCREVPHHIQTKPVYMSHKRTSVASFNVVAAQVVSNVIRVPHLPSSRTPRHQTLSCKLQLSQPQTSHLTSNTLHTKCTQIQAPCKEEG
jgi:hypothetical protein